MSYLAGMTQSKSTPAFIQPTASTVSQRIRRLRKSRSLTLHDIERLSQGRIKAVVMGSYERGTRAISLSRTIEIADLFGIPVTELISDGADQSRTETTAFVFDLRAIEKLSSLNDSTEIRHISRYLKALALRRRDWNGEVLSLRKSDFEQLSLLLDATEENLFQQLSDCKVLLRGPSHL
jgi:transcriptional regulator with XRE-family HTH domain